MKGLLYEFTVAVIAFERPAQEHAKQYPNMIRKKLV